MACSKLLRLDEARMLEDRGDPVERLKAIHAETDAAKQAVRSGQSSMYDLVNSLPPFAVALLNKALTPDMVLNMMKCNFVVSNVRGSARPMYLAGARVDAMYPMSLLANGMGLNFTCVSYVDNIDFGITYDVDLLPDPWRIADGLREALDEYLQICADTEHEAAPARKASTKRKAASKERPAAPKGVNLAVYARPHLVDERTVAWGMTDGRIWGNVQENPQAAYLFMHPGPGWSCVRLGLVLKEVRTTGSLLDAVRANTAVVVGDAAAAAVHRVAVFEVVEIRSLI